MLRATTIQRITDTIPVHGNHQLDQAIDAYRKQWAPNSNRTEVLDKFITAANLGIIEINNGNVRLRDAH